MKLNYFGTDLRTSGHFIWSIQPSGTDLTNMNLNTKAIPFDPEELTNPEKGFELRIGTVRWHRFGNYTVCAIQGSCSDDRPGSKSVFWVNEKIKFDELRDLILNITICKKIIDKLELSNNVKVEWGLITN